MRLKIERYGFIRDLEDMELTLVSDSQDIDKIKADLGNNSKLDDFGGFFVKIANGDYKEIYGYFGNIPDLSKSVFKIEVIPIKPVKSVKPAYLRQLPKKQREELTKMIIDLIELDSKELEIYKRIEKKIRKRRQFFKDVLHSRQTLENLKHMLDYKSKKKHK